MLLIAYAVLIAIRAAIDFFRCAKSELTGVAQAHHSRSGRGRDRDASCAAISSRSIWNKHARRSRNCLGCATPIVRRQWPDRLEVDDRRARGAGALGRYRAGEHPRRSVRGRDRRDACRCSPARTALQLSWSIGIRQFAQALVPVGQAPSAGRAVRAARMAAPARRRRCAGARSRTTWTSGLHASCPRTHARSAQLPTPILSHRFALSAMDLRCAAGLHCARRDDRDRHEQFEG